MDKDLGGQAIKKVTSPESLHENELTGRLLAYTLAGAFEGFQTDHLDSDGPVFALAMRVLAGELGGAEDGAED
jgi:hypothetical protein